MPSQGGASDDPHGAAGQATTEPGPDRPRVADRAAPPAGARIGRFTVLDVLGRGGMSVVVGAYDPKLDRRVALKLMHPGGGGSDDTEEVRARLLREARAMARLRHPNVVTVHDAGEHEGQVYLALEEVEGGSLRDELRRRREAGGGAAGWREVIDLFVSAGRGLIAAHEAGLVHRDFKPDNVLVDPSSQGGPRVAVADFGLVGVTGSRAEAGDSPARPRPADEPLTAEDVVIGTPLYMAPEQHRGERLDARADQFAFCVSLYEALYGELPFSGRTRDEYAESVERGEVRPEPSGTSVPAWVREVLLRGLRTDPNERYPTLEALLAEFGEESAQGARRWRVKAALALGIGFVILCAMSLGLEIDYRGLHQANGIALGLVALVYLLARNGLLRSRLNRQLYSVLFLGIVLVTFMHAGAQVAGLEPEESLMLIPLVSAAMSGVLAMLATWSLAPMALGYLAAFFVSAAWLEGGVLSLMLAHGIAFANVIFVMRPAPR